MIQSFCRLALFIFISNPLLAADWIPLFNGKDLRDWTPKFAGHVAGKDPHQVFRVEDGLLKVCYSGLDKFDGSFGHLFYKTPYSHYRIRAEVRFTGEQLAGGPEWAYRNNGWKLHPGSVGHWTVKDAVIDCDAMSTAPTFHENITKGNFAQATVAPSVQSHYLALLAREACYANGKPVTWDEVVASKEVMKFDRVGLKS